VDVCFDCDSLEAFECVLSKESQFVQDRVYILFVLNNILRNQINIRTAICGSRSNDGRSTHGAGVSSSPKPCANARLVKDVRAREPNKDVTGFKGKNADCA